jgi:hypothetical protein
VRYEKSQKKNFLFCVAEDRARFCMLFYKEKTGIGATQRKKLSERIFELRK